MAPFLINQLYVIIIKIKISVQKGFRTYINKIQVYIIINIHLMGLFDSLYVTIMQTFVIYCTCRVENFWTPISFLIYSKTYLFNKSSAAYFVFSLCIKCCAKNHFTNEWTKHEDTFYSSGHSYTSSKRDIVLEDSEVHILDRWDNWFVRGIKEAIYAKQPSLIGCGGL